MAEAALRAASPPAASAASRIALVTSSMKSGTPSVRSMISSRRSAGSSAALPASCHTRAAPSRRPSRGRAIIVTCGWPIQGGWNSGRKVAISKIGSRSIRASVRSSNSREVGSIQCTSSKTISNGCCRAIVSRVRRSRSKVFSFFRCGASSGLGIEPVPANDSKSASNGRSPFDTAIVAANCASLCCRAPGSSSRAKPAACSR